MTEGEGKKDVWSAIDQLRDSHTQTQKDLSGAIGLLKSLAEEVKHLAGVVNRPQERFNWIGFGALVVGILMCAAAYSKAIIEPIKEQGDQNHEIMMTRIMQLPESYHEAGYTKATVESLSALVKDIKARMHSVEQQAAHCEADSEAQARWIEDVDRYGSRKHVMSVPEVVQKP